LNKKFEFLEKQKLEGMIQLDRDVQSLNQNLSKDIDEIY